MTKRLPVVHSDERYEDNYAVRKKLADEAEANLRAAFVACGKADAYGRWVVSDKLKLLPDRVIYTAARDCGWSPSPSDVLGAAELDERYGEGFAVKGVVYRPFRFSVAFGALSSYNPMTPEQAKAAAERRREAAIAKQAAAEEAEPQLALPGLEPK